MHERKESKMKTSNHTRKHLPLVMAVTMTVLALATVTLASDIGQPQPEVLKGLYPGIAVKQLVPEHRFHKTDVRFDLR